MKSFKLNGDQRFRQLGTNYNIIKKKINCLSKLVEKEISEYNLLIQENHATILDGCVVVNYTLCMLLVQGIELFGCEFVPTLFCWATVIAFGIWRQWFGFLWGLYCSVNYYILCSIPDYVTHMYYCAWYYNCILF